jgi:hypothetical protein
VHRRNSLTSIIRFLLPFPFLLLSFLPIRFISLIRTVYLRLRLSGYDKGGWRRLVHVDSETSDGR